MSKAIASGVSETSSIRPGTSILVALKKWELEIGVTSVTTWRWRKRGWLQTLNIAGRCYLSGDAISEFQRRASAGEFSKEHVAPKRGKAEVAK